MMSQISAAMRMRTAPGAFCFVPWDETCTRASKALTFTAKRASQAGYVGQLSWRVTLAVSGALACLGLVISLLPAAVGTFFALLDLRKQEEEKLAQIKFSVLEAWTKPILLRPGNYLRIEISVDSLEQATAIPVVMQAIRNVKELLPCMKPDRNIRENELSQEEKATAVKLFDSKQIHVYFPLEQVPEVNLSSYETPGSVQYSSVNYAPPEYMCKTIEFIKKIQKGDLGTVVSDDQIPKDTMVWSSSYAYTSHIPESVLRGISQKYAYPITQGWVSNSEQYYRTLHVLVPIAWKIDSQLKEIRQKLEKINWDNLCVWDFECEQIVFPESDSEWLKEDKYSKQKILFSLGQEEESWSAFKDILIKAENRTGFQINYLQMEKISDNQKQLTIYSVQPEYMLRTEKFIEQMKAGQFTIPLQDPVPSGTEIVGFPYGKGLEEHILQISKQYEYPINQGWTALRPSNEEEEFLVWYCVVPLAVRQDRLKSEIAQNVDAIHTNYCDTGYILYDCKEGKILSSDSELGSKYVKRGSVQKTVLFSQDKWAVLREDLEGFLLAAELKGCPTHYLEINKISEDREELTIYADEKMDLSQNFLANYEV